ncbi:MAG TPA: uroporphyrinogen-III synthase [Ktedonobacteraceae bacterium]|nr:uroporphyrinogen-III synthase [Ktedonobacteraceae bacterium]
MSDPQLLALPLQGKRVLVTRTREQAGVLSEGLRAAGAIPVELPVIRIVPPEDWMPLDHALHAIARDGAYDWLIFTSANGVKMVLERLRGLGFGQWVLGNIRIAAIGPATAATLANYGLSASLVPDEYIAESVARGLRREAEQRGETLAGQRILLARAAEARQVLVSELEQAGASVEVVTAYRTLPVTQDDERGREVVTLLRAQDLDAITFTSSSTVQHFMRWLEQAAPDIASLLAYPGQRPARPLIACIGPVTAQTARDFGLEVTVEAREFTIVGLLEALINYEETHK